MISGRAPHYVRSMLIACSVVLLDCFCFVLLYLVLMSCHFVLQISVVLHCVLDFE